MLSYEQHPTVVEKQAALTAATDRREKLRVEIATANAFATSDARELERRMQLATDFDLAIDTEVAARDELHAALQAAIAELFPDLVAAQDAAANAEREHEAIKAELDDAVRCADPEETIADLRKALAAKDVEISRARRDVRKLVQKHGLG